jgi:hypothetical protein
MWGGAVAAQVERSSRHYGMAVDLPCGTGEVMSAAIMRASFDLAQNGIAGAFRRKNILLGDDGKLTLTLAHPGQYSLVAAGQAPGQMRSWPPFNDRAEDCDERAKHATPGFPRAC